jgi:hypothetical protein
MHRKTDWALVSEVSTVSGGGYQLSVIWKQQEAASLIQEETGE